MAEVQSQPQTTSFNYERYGSLKKVYNDIPVVHDSVNFAHSTLSTNPYTSYVYNASLQLGNQAYVYGRPLEERLSPLLTRADNLALSSIDAVESRFPYPFKTPTEEILKPVKEASDHAYNTFETHVRKPIDQLLVLSNEQFKQLQQHNVLVQRATDTVYRATQSLTAATKETSTKVHGLNERILEELHKVQASTAALPGVIQTSTKPLQAQLAQSVSELQAVIKSEGSASQKASKVAGTVQNQVGPVLEALKETYGNFLKSLSASTNDEVVPVTTDANGVSLDASSAPQ